MPTTLCQAAHYYATAQQSLGNCYTYEIMIAHTFTLSDIRRGSAAKIFRDSRRWV
jgi:hypothetical protein